MNQNFDVNTTIKMTRWMVFGCIAVAFTLVAAGLIFLRSENLPAGVALISISAPLNFLMVAFKTMSSGFRYQQSESNDIKAEIDQLKAAVQQLQGIDQSAISA